MDRCECAACQRKEPKPATGEDLAIYQEIADNFWRDKKIATLESDLATRTTQLSQVTLRMRELEHVANEWADMATNGLQWLRNISDGISTVDRALANMEDCAKHCAEVRDTMKVTP